MFPAGEEGGEETAFEEGGFGGGEGSFADVEGFGVGGLRRGGEGVVGVEMVPMLLLISRLSVNKQFYIGMQR